MPIDENKERKLEQLINNLISIVDKLNGTVKTTDTELFQLKSSIKKSIDEYPINDIKRLKEIFAGTSDELEDILNSVIKSKIAFQEKEEEFNNKISNINKTIQTLTEDLQNTDDVFTKFNIKIKIDELIKQKEDEKRAHEAGIEGLTSVYEARKEIEDRANKQKEEIEQKAKDIAEKRLQNLKEKTKKIEHGIDNTVKTILDLFKQGADRVVQSYEANAGNLAAALNSSINDISNLQRKIANELRSDSLNKAISNLQVMSEINSFTKAGYTNEDKLQTNATAIAIAKEIAPTLNLDTSSIKNLTNVFGSDFIERFSAIQTATQEAAGSTINISNNLTKMMSDLEPVYLNAEYQYNALQSTADIQATLSKAQDMNIIDSSQANEFQSMIIELMDPSKAFKSNKTTVRAAATTYDFGSGDPLQALQALLRARQSMYGGLDMTNSYSGNITRALAASAFNDDTLSATYHQQGLYGLDIVNTADLSSTYQQQEAKLKSGDFTTRKDREENWFDNSSMAQGLASFGKDFPLLYRNTSAKIIATITSAIAIIPNKIASKLAGILTTRSLFNSANITTDLGETTTTTLKGRMLNSDFIQSSAIGLGQKGSTLGKLTSSSSLAAYGLGITGALNIAGQWDSDRNFIQNVGMGGDTTSAMLANAGVGAGLGTAIGSFFPGLGNVVGGVLGGIAGGIWGLVAASKANKEEQEKNTEALKEQTQATKDLYGVGVVAVDELESKREIARGGGIAYLASGNYKIDVPSNLPGFATGLGYVPYDNYVARLHKGEAVVTAEAAQQLREKNPNFWNTQMNEDNDIVGALKEQTESIVNAVNGKTQYSPLTKIGPKQYVIQNQYI